MKIARAGDIAKCENGHELYRLTADCMTGQVMQSNLFEPISVGYRLAGTAPKIMYGQEIMPCHVCGAPWITPPPHWFVNLQSMRSEDETVMGADGRVWWREGHRWHCRRDGTIISSLEEITPTGETEAEVNCKRLIEDMCRASLWERTIDRMRGWFR